MQRDPRRRNASGWLSRQLRRRPKPLWLVVALHVLALGAALLIYAVPHHVMPRQQEAIGITSSRAAMSVATEPTSTPKPTLQPTNAPLTEAIAPSIAPTAEPTPEVTAAPTDGVGQFNIKFADKFTSGNVEYTDTTYRSANINVSFSTVRYEDSNVNVADIYVADISNFITVFSSDTYHSGSNKSEMVVDIAKRWNGIATLSGDYYGMRDGGVVIRNGTLYRDEKNTHDVCVLYWDGSMKCFSPKEFDAETEMSRGAYQCWNFGPMLLDENGNVPTSFNTDVNPSNPRAIVGYYEPGHYCFITVDGRSDESNGLTIKQCAAMCAQAGMKQAFNLDGGQTSVLAKAGQVYGVPYKGGRKVSDVLMIVDGATQGVTQQ